jgi:uncharacterized membrane protein YvbJ
MRKCPWCGRENLSVYSYCQSCGRGFAGPQEEQAPKKRRFPWPFGQKKAA